MSRFVNFIYRISDAHKQKGAQGTVTVLKRSFFYHFCFPLMFMRFKAILKDIPEELPAGKIQILKLTLRRNFPARWFSKLFARANWAITVKTRMLYPLDHKWSVREELEHFSTIRFPLVKNIPVQIPDSTGYMLIEAYLWCDFRWLKESRWRLLRTPVLIKKTIDSNPYTFHKDQDTPPRYLTVRLDITEGCNLGCKMCNIRDKDHNRKEITPFLFAKIKN